MASIQIPNLPAVVGLSGAELFEGVQAGTSVKISLDQLAAAIRTGLPTTLPLPVSLGGTGVTTSTGTGSVVLSDSPAFSGNVGIGTTAPAYTLEAAGASKAIATTGTGNPQFLAITSDAAGIPFVTLQNATSSWQNRNNGTTGDLSWSVSGSERMRITLGGNVGIGTASPSVKLDVVGSGVFTSNSDILTLKYASDIGSARLAWKNVAGTTLWDIVGGMVIRQDEFAIRRAGTSVIYLDNANNVGIGTTSPAVKLHVVSSTGGILESLRLQNDSTFATSGRGTQISFRGTSGGLLGTITASTSTTANDQGSLNYSANGATSFHRFDTNSAERMRIDSAGNVGIGTISSTGRLTVADGTTAVLTLRATSAIDTAGRVIGTINFQEPEGIGDGTLAIEASINALRVGSDSFNSGGDLNFSTRPFNGSLTERMRITSDGNVGIGVTPSAWISTFNAIQVGSAAGFVGSSLTSQSLMTANSYYGVGGLRYINTAQACFYQQYQGVHSWFNAPSGTAGNLITFTQAMTLDASGNLGIGNTAPVTKLHVTGASITTGVTYLAQPAQTSKAAAATLTIAELLTGIVQYTGAAATLTLPTGTSIEGGLPATFPTDMSFDVSFINTGAGLLTIGANGNTTVGTITVATLTSAMLRFRKTAANTYTVYRIS